MFSTRHRRTAWLIALCVAAALGSLVFARERQYAAAQDDVRATLAARRVADDTLSLLKDAETGQRGFLLTGDDDLLGPYTKAERALPAEVQRLAKLVANDPEQAASAREIQRLASAKLGAMRHTIELKRQGQTQEALAIVRGRGRQLMDALRVETDRMLAREDARLLVREHAVRDARRELGFLITGAWTCFVCVVALGIWSAMRGVTEAKRAHEQLQESEKALRTVADNASDLVRVIGNAGDFVYVSPSCAALLGYSQADMLATAPRSLLAEDEREEARRRMEQARSTQGPFPPFVHRILAKDGTYRWFETRYSSAGTPEDTQIHLTSRDITERKAAEDALRTQTARLESILSSMGDGVVVLDEQRRFLIVNPVAREYIHQDEGEHAPQQWAARHHAYMLDGKTPFPSDEGPLTRALAGEACDAVELVLYDKTIAARTFSVTARPIGDGGTSAGCVAVYRDITEARRAEKELRESEQRLRVLAEASFEGVLVGRDGIILDTNALLASWLGCEPSDLVGARGLSLFAPEEHERLQSMIGQPALYYETYMLHKDGARFPVEVRSLDTTFRGGPARIAVIRDITDKRQREAELKQQAELLRTMSLRDELTGLYNRRGFQEHATQSFRNAKRSQRTACVFFADLNGLKSINDTLGHDMGDRAIAATGSILSAVFRDSDIVARLGGDEFAIFATECNSHDVAAVRERLRQQIDDANRSGTDPFRLSISIGAAVFEPGSHTDLNALLETADRLMYEEKRANAL